MRVFNILGGERGIDARDSHVKLKSKDQVCERCMGREQGGVT